ncbi:MAG: hypothetical protein ACPLX7_10135 [Candidatus Kapaibacteriota bacterium]
MKTIIIIFALAFMLTFVQTVYSIDFEQINNTEIKLIKTNVKLPDGKEYVITRQIRTTKKNDTNRTFEVEIISKKFNILELQINSRTNNILTITQYSCNIHNFAPLIKIPIFSTQNKMIILEIKEDEPLILFFNSDDGEYLIRKIF